MFITIEFLVLYFREELDRINRAIAGLEHTARTPRATGVPKRALPGGAVKGRSRHRLPHRVPSGSGSVGGS